MSIVPIHRRGANASGGRAARRPGETRAGQPESAPPDRVPILMRMPDLARIDPPEPDAGMAPIAFSPAARPAKPGTATRPTSAPARTRPARTVPMTPRPSQADELHIDDDDDMTTTTPTEVRTEHPRRPPRRRRERPLPQSPQSWVQPSHLLIGAAIIAVIISIVAMIRRPAVQTPEAPPPLWNPGNAAQANPAAPLAGGAPGAAVPQNPLPASPVPAMSASQGLAPAAPAQTPVASPQPGAWAPVQPPPAQNPPSDLPLPEPTAQRGAPGQWGTGGTPVAPVAVTPPATATLMGTIDKPEQPTLRAEHERIGQGVY